MPRYMGPSVPKYVGPSVPRYMGPSVPRYMGPSVPRYMGPSVPWIFRRFARFHFINVFHVYRDLLCPGLCF